MGPPAITGGRAGHSLDLESITHSFGSVKVADDVSLPVVLANPETDVPPIRMWSMLESTLDVRTAAVSGVLVATTALSVFVMDRVAGPARRLT